QEDYHLYVDPHNTLVVTHLQSMKLFKHIPIQIGDGPDLFNRIPQSAVAIDISSFLVESYPNFYIINDKGFVKKRLFLNELLREEMKKLSIDKEILDNVILSRIGFQMNQSAKGEFIFIIR